MGTSPQLNAEGVVRVKVFSNGKALDEVEQLISVTVNRAVNAVPSARLVFTDGDMPRRTFPVSDGNDFRPGAEIKINAGYGESEDTLFEGIVVKHGVKISGRNDARLVVDCRDKAVRMTVGRKNANYIDQKDGDIIKKLVSAHGLSADVESTVVQYRELVQNYTTDWDFVLARAEANGLLVVATDGALAVKPPLVSGESALTVTYGEDLFDFQAEMDARSQYASVQAVSWDMKTQAPVLGAEASPAKLNAQGDLDSAALAKVVGLSTFRLQTGAPLSKEALTQWAKALQLKSGLARIRGRMSFQGSAKAKVGELIELKGVGARFSGKVFVSGLSHEIGEGHWITEAEFGMSPAWFTERPDVMAPPAAGLLPGVEGLQVGVVMQLDQDPDGEHRVKVSVPVLQATTEGIWARLMKFHGSNGFGAFFLPEIGDEVVLGYFNNDPSNPVILGSVYSSKQVPPYPLEAKNNIKALVTRCKSKIEFHEEDKVITIATPGGNKIVLSDKDKSILLTDQNGNQVKLDPKGITLDSPKDIAVTAKGTITLDAVGAISITSQADVKSAGLNVNCEAQVGFVGKGSASAELSAAGQTVVKGAMVMIN